MDARIFSTGFLIWAVVAAVAAEINSLNFLGNVPSSDKIKYPSYNQTSCPCSDPNLCKPITTTPKKEVFAFILSSRDYLKFDWSKMTTIVLFLKSRKDSSQIMCYAHSKGVKVAYGVDFPKSKLGNVQAEKAWVQTQVKFAVKNHLDGVNFDYESSMAASDLAGRVALNRLVRDLHFSFKQQLPHSQVTFDVAYKPATSRHFDYEFIAKTVDFIVVMGYDQNGYCVPGANAGVSKTVAGVKDFLALRIPASKIVLALPWYGYDFPCSSIDKNNICTVSPRCGAKQILYSDAMGKRFKHATSSMLWDAKSQTPYFNYKDSRSGKPGQVWCDNGRSLSIKYKWAWSHSLLGVGMWRVDAIDYSDTAEGRKEQKEMWGALP